MSRVAWAAGFFDGEGNVRIKQHNKTGQYCLAIHASQVSQKPLLILQELFGGTVTLKKKASPNWRAVYEWRCHTRMAARALRLMQPWLIVKSAQAELALEFVANLGRHGGHERPDLARRHNIKLLMNQLNARGAIRERLVAENRISEEPLPEQVLPLFPPEARQ